MSVLLAAAVVVGATHVLAVETVAVKWELYPVAEALARQCDAKVEVRTINSYCWVRPEGTGFLCPAGPTPEGYADVTVADGGTVPYIDRKGVTNRFDLAYVMDVIVGREQCLVPGIEPLRSLARPTGGYDYVSYGTSGGRGERLGFDQFGGILAAGEFERKPGLVFRTKSEAGRRLGAALAEAANRIGPEELLRFHYYPLEVRYPQKTAPDRKFVYAHAMQCFLLGGIPEGFAHSYPSDVKSEDFSDWPPAAAPGTRTWWSERLSPFVHTPTLEAARLDLDCAEKAGLDAMGVLVYPGCLCEDSPWHGGIERMCAAAETHKVKVLFDLWGTFPPSWPAAMKRLYTAEHGRRLKALFDRYPKAWLRVNGKIAFQFGCDQVKYRQKASDYRDFWTALGGRENYYLVCTQMDSRGHNFFNGWEGCGDLSTHWYVHCGWGDRTCAWVLDPIHRDRNDRLAWGVPRGYNRANFGSRADGGCITEGFGACMFNDAWREAVARDCGAVYVQSWNDMSEDHHILESNFLGDSFIRLSGYFAEWFKTGREPPVREEKLLMFHRRHLVDAKMLTHPGRDQQHPSWASAPLCDYVHVVTMLKAPGAVELDLGGERLKLDRVDAGLREWLVLVPRAKDHGGNRPFWNGDSYAKTLPYDTDYRTVTAVKAIPACHPVASVKRGGKTVLTCESRTGIAGEFKFHTMNVVGSVSK